MLTDQDKKKITYALNTGYFQMQSDVQELHSMGVGDLCEYIRKQSDEWVLDQLAQLESFERQRIRTRTAELEKPFSTVFGV